MSPYKTACVVSLGSLAALVIGFMIASEVRAGSPHEIEDVPISGMVDQDTIEQASAFAGDYTFVGGQKERDKLNAAIETSLDALSPIVRGLGRTRLQESNQIPKRSSNQVEGEKVESLFDGKSHGAPLEGTPIRTKSPDGEKVKISHRMRGNKLNEFIDGGKGARTNNFKLNGDGSRLTVDVTISSGHLPVPVDYRLTFKRK